MHGSLARRGSLQWGAVLLVGLFAVGCGASESPPPAPVEAEPAAAPVEKAAGPALAKAQEVFTTRCVTCHGAQGAGDGPGSAALNPKPRNFQDADWQASVTDEHLANIIQYGGAAVGKSPTMPGNPDLSGQPDVVAALVAHIRGLPGS